MIAPRAVAALVGVLVAVAFGVGWWVALEPLAGPGMPPFLLVLVVLPAGVALAIGVAVLTGARLAGDVDRLRPATDDAAAALAVVVSALGYALVATLTAGLVDLEGFVALAVGLAAGTLVGATLAWTTYRRVTPSGDSVFAAGALGRVGIALTALAVGTTGTFVVGILATALLVLQSGHAPQIPLLSIPIGVAAGLVLVAGTVLALQRHVRRLPTP